MSTRSGLARVWHRRPTAVVLIFAALSVWDLRIELQLLLEHFTFSGLRAAVLAHPLAVAVLLALPMLQGLSRRQRPGVPISSSGPSRP